MTHRLLRTPGRTLPVMITVVAVLGTATAAVALAPSRLVGPRPNGRAVTSQGYFVTPAGDQTTVGNLPLATALSPDGRALLVVNAGQGTQSVQVLDTRTSAVVQTIPYASPAAVYGGVAFSPDGTAAYVSGGGSNVIHRYAVAGGRLTEGSPIALPTVSPSTGVKVNMFPAGLAVTPDGRRLLVADQLADAASLVDVTTGAVTTASVGHRPYGVALSGDGATAYVADQGGETLDVLDVAGAAPVVRAQLRVGTHPNKVLLSPDGSTLYVSNGDSDSVSVVDTGTLQVARTLDLRPYRDAQVGSNPTALALSGDGRSLYVAASGNNAVVVLDVGTGRQAGLVPVGWYPTALAVADGRLWVANGKGLGAGPNDGPGHPDPTSSGPRAEDQYIGSMIRGTVSAVREPAPGEQLAKWTAAVVRNNDVEAGGAVRTSGRSTVVPRRVGQDSPIKHVIYVVKENRTYDQVLGSLGKGNGDPSLNLFGEESAPNARQLSREYTTFDNFYADAEVSANGWNWVTAANSNPFSEQQWPANYSRRGAPYPSENSDPAIVPNRDVTDGYIWNRLAEAGKSFRNYGFYVSQDATGANVATDATLQAGTNPAYRGYDLACPDSSGTFVPLKPTCGRPRVDVWLDDFRAAEQSGQLPAVQFVRLPSDHTAGTRPGSPTPRAYVADNDLALGRLVEAVSNSKFWDSTAIFVTEDDAQNGPDHVDAHRTLALAISPYTRTGRVDSHFYDTAAMLRTMELFAGIGPLTQFDAYATPMNPAFVDKPDPTPYTLRVPTTPLDAVNPPAPATAGAARTVQLLDKEDQIDEKSFNQEIWQSVRGAGSVVPVPQHHVIGAGARPADPTEAE